MTSLRLFPVLLAAAGACAAVESAAVGAAALADLAGLSEEAVLAGTLVGGNRLDLSRFTDARAPHALLAAVRAAWSQRPAPVHEAVRDGWLTLTQAVDDAVEVLEVRATASGGSEGRRARWRHAGAGGVPAGMWLDAVLPPGSRILQRLVHQDAGREMTTIVALTDAVAATAARRIVAALERAGFSRRPGAFPSFSSAGVGGGVDRIVGGGEAFFLGRRQEEVAVTVSDQGVRRAVVIHWGRRLP